MAMMPKRVKHRKSQRGRIKGDATRGNRVVFGDFGLQALQGNRMLQLRGGCHDHGVDASGEQFFGCAECPCPDRSGRRLRRAKVGIDYAGDGHGRQFGQDARVIAAHDADADHPHPQGLIRRKPFCHQSISSWDSAAVVSRAS